MNATIAAPAVWPRRADGTRRITKTSSGSVSQAACDRMPITSAEKNAAAIAPPVVVADSVRA